MDIEMHTTMDINRNMNTDMDIKMNTHMHMHAHNRGMWNPCEHDTLACSFPNSHPLQNCLLALNRAQMPALRISSSRKRRRRRKKMRLLS